MRQKIVLNVRGIFLCHKPMEDPGIEGSRGMGSWIQWLSCAGELSQFQRETVNLTENFMLKMIKLSLSMVRVPIRMFQ